MNRFLESCIQIEDEKQKYESLSHCGKTRFVSIILQDFKNCGKVR